MRKMLVFVPVFVFLAVLLSACAGGSPTGPGPTDGNGNPCPTGTTSFNGPIMQVEVKYVRQVEKVRPDSISIPGMIHRAFDQGQSQSVHERDMVRHDFLTWSTKLNFPENARGPSHRISAGDPALAPNSWITATDIFVNGVLVAKGVVGDNVGEAGWFRVDGCGKAVGMK